MKPDRIARRFLIAFGVYIIATPAPVRPAAGHECIGENELLQFSYPSVLLHHTLLGSPPMSHSRKRILLVLIPILAWLSASRADLE